ncbi:hypothetical protein DLM75_23975 [Leptospira stimsonii]|uniref:Lipoprotein n=1 Tax=Leptospira stimsonii TaxID=2202203 RepID=A0A396YRC0_9LEPT|nr:hypothetical protein DLM75_23975 [Leptospira stimsonii]
MKVSVFKSRDLSRGFSMHSCLRIFIQALVLLLISCNAGRFISPGLRSNMYLAEGVRTNSYLIENRVFVKAIALNQNNFETIKEDSEEVQFGRRGYDK